MSALFPIALPANYLYFHMAKHQREVVATACELRKKVLDSEMDIYDDDAHDANCCSLYIHLLLS